MRLAVVVALSLILAAPAAARHHTLTHGQAKRIALKRGARVAHKPVKVSSLTRWSAAKWTARVEWTNTVSQPCAGCGYNEDTDTFYDTTTPETEYCSVSMSIRLLRHSHRVRVSLTDSACY